MEGGQYKSGMGCRVRIRGAVQGVGFRPTVYRIARDMNIAGWVLNDNDGVLVHLDYPAADAFLNRLTKQLPHLARIDRIECKAVAHENLDEFQIRKSDSSDSANTCISADAATCDACLEDILDPFNRRYGYAFTNCTHCGPRYSITEKVPYDRANTSMAEFPMCAECAAEYHDPFDRRFHAQPNACAKCGPQLTHNIADISDILARGGCVAIKGLGGYQLLADARQEKAVARLRAIKKRDAKPFAVMVAGLASGMYLADLSAVERAQLIDHRRPIVVARATEHVSGRLAIADSVTLGLKTIGLMLPTTPLHYLIFHHLAGRPRESAWLAEPHGTALVCTSANIAGEPLITDDDAAEAAFEGLVDLVVGHNRAIITPVDDSVVRVIDGAPMLLRRARGYAPDPIDLPIAADLPSSLCLGAELKNTICITRDDQAFVSPHIGNQRGVGNQALQAHTISHMLSALDVAPAVIATDLHPDMNNHVLGNDREEPILRVQHHQAHIASVAAEHQIDGPLLGLALDGYGLASDGQSSWGGELITINGASMIHHASLQPLAQPGGDAAALAPWRMAVSLLTAAGLDPSPYYGGQHGFQLITAMLQQHLNCPPTSSAGRLFDAVSSIAGLCHINAYEGEAAMRLEDQVTKPQVFRGGWRLNRDGDLSMLPLIPYLAGQSAEDIANLFHGTIAAAMTDWICHHSPAAQPVALSGGCLQNAVLARLLATNLRARGYEPLFNRAVPANDGGLALGQAYVAAHHLKSDLKSSTNPLGEKSCV